MATPDRISSWLRTGDQAFEEMLAAIAAAAHSVRLETYIFAASPLGEQFRSALVRACERGARVRMLVDALGSWSLPASFWTPLQQVGGEFRWFNPLNLRRITFRNHRKLLVCDEAVGFIGGFNLAPEWQGDGITRGWRDLGLRLEGELARDLALSFDALFERADFQHPLFTRLRRTVARGQIAREGGEALLSGPGRGPNAIKRALLTDLAQARRVQIIAAYFLPVGRLRRALMRVARRGGQVQLILPAKTDVRLSRLASQSFYTRLLRAGVEIFEYQPQVLHTKLVVADRTCFVGSANLDARSLNINYELTVRLDDPILVAEARTIFTEHLEHSVPIQREAWQASRTFWSRLKGRFACLVLARLDPLVMRQQLKRLLRNRAP